VSRKDNRQSIRFTANARWSITDSGKLNLPKIGAVKVTWSRTLPAQPSSVTVIKDAAGRYFASFVIDTDPRADAARMPDTSQTVGIDLGLTHFAVLSNGTKIGSPRLLRRAEKKLKKAQRELSRKQKGSALRVDRSEMAGGRTDPADRSTDAIHASVGSGRAAAKHPDIHRLSRSAVCDSEARTRPRPRHPTPFKS
jgi:putative transposase